MISAFRKVENVVGKGENADLQYFLLFLQCFCKPFSLGSLTFGIVWNRIKSFIQCATRSPKGGGGAGADVSQGVADSVNGRRYF